MTCAIVIPFYQREDGVLRRALESVFAQSFQDFRIIVVDDASPYSAQEELASLPEEQRERIQVIRQTNAGPGGARNTGLDAAEGVEFVALLDSDDVWDEGHLERAATAIRVHGADVYIAAISGGAEFDYHSDFESVLSSSSAEQVSNQPDLRRVKDLAWRMVEDWSFLHLSCLVMSASVFSKARFASELRLAGEDVLFFYDALSISKSTVLSPDAGAVRGLGTNLFHGVGNTADIFIQQQACVLRMFDMMASRSGAESQHRALLARRKQDVRLDVMWGQRDRLKSGKGLQIGQLAALFIRDPAMPGSVLSYMLRKGAPKQDGSNDAAASS